MKIDDGIADWFRVCVMVAVGLGLVFGIHHCIDEDVARRKKFAEANPVEAAQKNCYSKVRGSRPACWSEADWIVYCERVQCKQ
mgnify:FL=1